MNKVYMRPLVFIILAILAGCSPSEPAKDGSIVVRNDAQGAYVKKVESISSDAASALTALSPLVQEGVPRQLNDAQALRLATIAPPSVAKVEEYKKILATNDSKAVANLLKENKQIQSENNDLRKKVGEAEAIANDAEAVADLYERKAARLTKNNLLLVSGLIGAGLFVIGLLAVAFTPFKKSGGTVMAGSVLAFGAAWLFDNSWFAPIAGTSFGLVCVSLLAIFGKWAWDKFKSV